MKILQLGKFFPIGGGIEKVMLDIAQGIARRGIDSDILYASRPNDERRGGSKVIAVADRCNIILSSTIVELSSTMISSSMVSTLKSICDNYDVIDIHHPDPMAALALWVSGYRGTVVLHWHSDVLRQKLLLRLYHPLLTWLLNRAQVIVTTSPVYSLHSRYLRRVSEKCRVIPIGISPLESDEKMVRAIRERFDNRRIIFYLGRLVGYKGIKYLIRAARDIPEEYVALIGGCGPLRRELEEEISRLGLSSRVKMLGYIPQEHIGAYYKASSLFCLPSINKAEAFGIVQLEAMASGRPVISTSIEGSGVGWVNRHGESGVTVRPCDPAGIAQAVVDICGDSKVYKKYCEGAYERYRTVFDDRRMIDSYVELYSQLVGQSQVSKLVDCML